jgi:hypothetical protein
MGDNIAWMPYVEEYRKKHNAEINYYLHQFNLSINLILIGIKLIEKKLC